MEVKKKVPYCNIGMSNGIFMKIRSIEIGKKINNLHISKPFSCLIMVNYKKKKIAFGEKFYGSKSYGATT